MRTLLPDLTPLRTNPAYRRLWLGFTLAGVGAQMATVAIGLHVFELTGSTAAVGLVGLFALVPLVVMGLYGGALADQYDRRIVAIVAQLVAWLSSVLLAVQAFLGNTSVWVLYVLVAMFNAAFAVMSPARSSIYPRILPREQLPAANALSVLAMNTAMTVGPLLAGVLIGWHGFEAAYAFDALITTAALWGLLTLGPIKPDPSTVVRRAGIGSVIDGFRFLGRSPNVRMTFITDIFAMVLAQPRVLLPAAGTVILGGGATTVGNLYASAAAGGIIAMFFSGRLGSVRRQGVAILVSICGWGAGIAGLGVALVLAGGPITTQQAFWVAMLGMFVAGASDAVSAVYRTTILQSAAPDHMRGRLQGVFIVVVAGGPRVGEMLGGVGAELVGEGWTAVVGGLLVIAVMAWFRLRSRRFVEYDARDPQP
ncbi:MAG: MFS transporter [Intrasporangiaceae bacterium]|nr:MFS transporter [Intrasporangiaceae bacterium]